MRILYTELVAVVGIARDRLAIWWLRRKILQEKAAKYDELVANMVGLRRAIATYKRMASSLQEDLETSRVEANGLRSEYAELRSRSAGQAKAAAREARLDFFSRILPVLVQLPSIRAAVINGASVEANDILVILNPLDQAIKDLGFSKIGEVGQKIAFDPKQHRVLDDEAPLPREQVLVQFVGYSLEGEIIAKADVTCVKQPQTA